MSLYLGHESALRYWLTKRGDEAIPDPSGQASLADSSATASEIKMAALPFDFSSRRPLQLLVSDSRQSHKLAAANVHLLTSPLPPGSFCDLVGTTHVASPELTFVLMARDKTVQELAEIGCYLCGGFAIGDEGCGYVCQRSPLTTPEDIRAFISRLAPHTRGVSTASRALRYVVPHTVSPEEVLLALTCSLPPSLGGRSMPKVVANQRIDIPKSLRDHTGATHFFGDLFFRSVRGDMEYDSEEYHTGKYRLDHTMQRRNILETAGIKVVSATYGQISSYQRFLDFWWMAERRYGIRHKSYSWAQQRAQENLYAWLMDRTRRLF